MASAAAREEQLRREQADLQKQVNALTDQIGVLRMQTTTLSTRNQALESVAFSPTLVWLLIALSVIAIAVAGWMALRYAQLRRSLEGSAWWSGNTVQAPTSGAAITRAKLEEGARTGAANTRLGVAPADGRGLSAAAAAAAASASNVQDRSRPAVRGAGQASPIDTDFTVSDIEAAMATVRTVSPSRPAQRPAPRTTSGPLEDSDFAALGGPTVPSPFADPPPPPASAADGATQTSGTDERDSSAGAKPDAAVDLGITALISTGAARQPPTAHAPEEAPHEETTPLDFKLDIPDHYDPLATSSFTTTAVERSEPSATVDFELPSTSTALDFELPSVTEVTPLSPSDSDVGNDAPTRHAATALNDIFPSMGAPGVDTILNLDERDHAPLVTTDVNRLATTEVEATRKEGQHGSIQSRLVRFGDLVRQVDEAVSDDPLRAIAMLRQYVLRDEQIPTLMWLRLFELYRQVDKDAVYEALAEHFARRYHRTMVGWNESLADRASQTPLAAMVEIDREIEAKWGSEEGLERLRSLLCDRDQPDAIVFNAALQRDLLDAVKVYPMVTNTLSDFGSRIPPPSESSR